MEIILHIDNNVVANHTLWENFLKELKDGSYTVAFKPRKYRSLNQNAYYWGIMVPMVKDGLREQGYDEVKSSNDAHEVLKALFRKREIVNKETGQLITVIPGSTTDMSTSEFKIYMEEIGKWAAEFLGINIPPPGMQMTILK